MKKTFIFEFVLIFSMLSSACNSQVGTGVSTAEPDSVAQSADTGNENKPVPQQENGRYLFARDIPVPDGYERIDAEKGSVAEYLRNLPLKTENNTVYLYNGEEKRNQTVQFAVIKMDVGRQDLQQCADAVMRLRAEYLYGAGRKDEIRFNFTSGDVCRYSGYRDGYRAKISGNKVTWVKTAAKDTSYACFRNYLDLVFTYAGTASLEKELSPVEDVQQIMPGDVFIQGGHPGHAVTVMDVAVNKKTGKRIFMLSQSYMPAQEIHILKNQRVPEKSPWYDPEDSGRLDTPEWDFNWSDLRRF